MSSGVQIIGGDKQIKSDLVCERGEMSGQQRGLVSAGEAGGHVGGVPLHLERSGLDPKLVFGELLTRAEDLFRIC